MLRHRQTRRLLMRLAPTHLLAGGSLTQKSSIYGSHLVQQAERRRCAPPSLSLQFPIT